MHRVRLAVTNLNWSDATLYVHRGVERRRLGIVTGKGDAELVVRWPTAAALRVEIVLPSGESCLTRETMVRPGERLEVEVPADLSMDPACRPPAPS